MRLNVVIMAGVAAATLSACSDREAAVPATATVSTAASGTGTPLATATATRSSGGTTTASPAISPTVAADGTVDPLNPGQQTPWTVKSNPDPSTGVALVTALRMGVHPEQGGWERIVFEFAGPNLPGATIAYVDSAVSCGSGQSVSVRGTAILQVAIVGADAHDTQGKATIPREITGPGRTVIGGTSICDFEAHVTWAFGLVGRRNFKVSTLTNPTRLVIDVKQ